MFARTVLTTLLLFNISFADDRFYELGKKFLLGMEGTKSEKVIVNNCPYEACKLDEQKIRTIDIETPNSKDGIKLLEQSVANTGNNKSAVLIVEHLLSQINYKDKEFSQFLLAKIKKEYDLDQLGFNLKIKKYVDYLYKKDTCEGRFFKGHFATYGFLYAQDIVFAKKELARASEECKKTNILYYQKSISEIKSIERATKAEW